VIELNGRRVGADRKKVSIKSPKRERESKRGWDTKILPQLSKDFFSNKHREKKKLIN